MIEAVFLALGCIYAAIMWFFYAGIRRARLHQRNPVTSPSGGPPPFVSVLVPARNEAATIAALIDSLAVQTYPTDAFEVLIIDDRSSDGTAAAAAAHIERLGVPNMRVLSHQPEGDRPTYKKAALRFAMASARGEIICTVDADCRVQPRWLAGMIAAYDADTGLVAGLVAFDRGAERTLFHKMQTLEFAGLVFAGVGAVGNGYPIICNGSNLSYRRQAFEDVGGFAGHEHLPSGDDDLLLQHLHRHTDWKVRYQLDPATINYTHPVDTPRDFINQRTRWASKSTHYPGHFTFALLLAIYLEYAVLLGAIPAAITGLFPGGVLLAGLFLKIAPEMAILWEALDVIRRRDLFKYIPVAELVQIPYIVWAGLAGLFNWFQWKQPS